MQSRIVTVAWPVCAWLFSPHQKNVTDVCDVYQPTSKSFQSDRTKQKRKKICWSERFVDRYGPTLFALCMGHLHWIPLYECWSHEHHCPHGQNRSGWWKLQCRTRRRGLRQTRCRLLILRWSCLVSFGPCWVRKAGTKVPQARQVRIQGISLHPEKKSKRVSTIICLFVNQYIDSWYSCIDIILVFVGGMCGWCCRFRSAKWFFSTAHPNSNLLWKRRLCLAIWWFS